jgi:hypothetical protein
MAAAWDIGLRRNHQVHTLVADLEPTNVQSRPGKGRRALYFLKSKKVAIKRNSPLGFRDDHGDMINACKIHAGKMVSREQHVQSEPWFWVAFSFRGRNPGTTSFVF